MVKSLCGKHPCPAICERVCHCEAGLARARWLGALARNKRERYRTRAAPPKPCPPDVNPLTGERYRTRHPFDKAKETVLYNVFGPRKYPRRARPIAFGQTTLGIWSPFVPNKEGSKRGRTIALIILLVFAVLFSFAYLNTDHQDPNRAEIGVEIDHQAEFWQMYNERR